MTTLIRRFKRSDDGSSTVEFLLWMIPMFILVMFTVLVWRLAGAEGEVQDAAQAGARAASLARTPGEASAAGQAAAAAYLPANSTQCSSSSIAVNTGRFYEGFVTVTVTCNTDNGELAPLDRTGPDAVVQSWTEAVDLARTARDVAS